MAINVLDYLENSEKRFPEKTAYEDNYESVTFHEFAKRARRLGSHLARRQIIRKPVAIYLEKSVAMIEGFLGSVYAGCFYCPIDISMPEERIKLILGVLKPAAIITDEAHKDSASSLAKDDEGTPMEIVLLEDAFSGDEDDSLLASIRAKSVEDDPLYVLFTSGSTGIPKGVLVSHRVILNNMEWLDEEYDFTSDDVLGNQVPFYFDVSNHDIYSVLKFSCSMVIIPPEDFAFPVRLVEFLNEHRVTAIFWVPFALSMAANLNAFASIVPKYLRYIFFAGEVMPVKQLNYWRRYIPNALYCNMYGPTETYVCTYYNVDREFADDETLPIGRACKNIEALILDEDNNEIRPGDEKVGELCIRGAALALGYYNNSEMTAERFVQNPLQSAWPDRIYKTGDIAGYNEYGELTYVGREDTQIKHLGYRIELGEIETAAAALDTVESCACLYDYGKKQILLVYSGIEMPKKEFSAALAERIPKYMMPNRFIYTEKMPHNANGKTDRARLKELYT